MYTYRQQIILQKVQEHINSLRCMLDDMMYGHDSEKLSDYDRTRLRETYDLICQANDKL